MPLVVVDSALCASNPGKIHTNVPARIQALVSTCRSKVLSVVAWDGHRRPWLRRGELLAPPWIPGRRVFWSGEGGGRTYVRRWIGAGQRRLDRASLELCPLDRECTVGIRSRVPLRCIDPSR